MSTVQDAPPRPSAEPGGIHPQLYMITTEDFSRMLEAEVFPDEARVELWDGQVVEKMAKSIPHAASGMKVLTALARVVPPGWTLSSENPVALNARSTPLPEFSIVRGGGDDYAARQPTAGDVALIVELSVTSLRKDTTTRMIAMARAGIPAYWVVDPLNKVILVFEQPIPAEGRYEASQTIAVGQGVPLRLDGALVAEIPAVDLLPVPR